MSSQEKELSEFLEHLRGNRFGQMAAYLRISGLQYETLRSEELRSLTGLLVSLATRRVCSTFTMASRDVFVFYPQERKDEMDAVFLKMRFSLSKDPLVRNHPNDFCRRFALQKDFKAFEKLVDFFTQQAGDTLYDGDLMLGALPPPANASVKPSFFEGSARKKRDLLDLPRLIAMERSLKNAEISSMIRRQGICAMIGNSQPQMLFEEVFIAISEMQSLLMPGVDLYGSPLFYRVTESLDRRVLALISRHEDGSLQKDFSININVSTILSPEFAVFDDHISQKARHSIVLELQPTDVFSDIETYVIARNFLKDRGYRLCLDGLTADTLPLMDREALGIDFLKMMWRTDGVGPSLLPALADGEAEHVILCRVDNEFAVTEGQKQGISLFQGRFVQELLKAPGSRYSNTTTTLLLGR